MFDTLEDALKFTQDLTKDDLEKLNLFAEMRKFDAERLVHEEEVRYKSRNNNNNDSHSGDARIYTFYDPVKAPSVTKCMEEIGNWSRRDAGQNIKIVLNSPGGAVLDGLALYDYLLEIRRQGHHVEVVTLGVAASMGGVILQAGDVRTMGRNSWLLIHEVGTGSTGTISEIEEDLEFSKRLQDNIVEILAARSTLTSKSIKLKWKKKDWWLNAQEALDLELIDQIQ